MQPIDIIKDFTEPSVGEADKIEMIANDLYARIADETEKILRSQLTILGVDISDMELIAEKCKKTMFPINSKALAIYEYEGKKILGVRISDNGIIIEFDVPKLPFTEKRQRQILEYIETQTKEEVQDV